MKKLWTFATAFLLFVSLVHAQATKPAPARDPKRWEKDIAAFEAKDAEKTPEPGGVVFVGSSSIKGWKLDTYFPELHGINRGFGGSEVADSVYFADRIVIKYKPRVVVLYAGDNDIGGGKSAEQVAADDRAFIAKVRAALPDTRIVRISVKPSIKLWAKWPIIQDLNRLLAEQYSEEKNVVFVDITKEMLGDDGKPRPELLLKDGLHMTPKGYEIWTRAIKSHL